MSIMVKCSYCNQMTKANNCGFYRGVPMHNKPNCNCIQSAIKSGFIVVEKDPKKRF